MIAVLDLGFGNVASVMNMLKKIGVSTCVADSKTAIALANGIIMPGVGSFDACMKLVKKNSDLFQELEKKVLSEKIPFLGICVGMQMLFETSAEGDEPGLGWISGHVEKFSFDDHKTKIPHMGWSELKLENTVGGLLDAQSLSRFYFVHSYYVQCFNPVNSIATAHYGDKRFTAAVNHENIYGVQFHPEKSHKFGLSLLKNFSRLVNV
jgi:imidazole glycerol-phosphate synthase subunit HisH